MKPISLKLPETLDERLESLASERGISKSELVREAIVEYLPDEAPGGTSFFALTRDLAGSVEGPEDLSTNAEYLEGLGR